MTKQRGLKARTEEVWKKVQIRKEAQGREAVEEAVETAYQIIARGSDGNAEELHSLGKQVAIELMACCASNPFQLGI